MKLLAAAVVTGLVLHADALGQSAKTFGTTLKDDGIRKVVTEVISEVRHDERGVLKLAEVKVTKVSEGFLDDMVKRISPVEVVDTSQEQEVLTDGFRGFMYAFVKFVAGRTPKAKHFEIELNERDVEGFLKERPDDHCGLIPCDLEKCCPTCKPKPCGKRKR
jgi:hypothetical protein